MNIDYQERIFWCALEDLAPNIVEVDPIGVNPILKYEELDVYKEILHMHKGKIRKATKNLIIPLLEKDREEQLQYYKDLNKNIIEQRYLNQESLNCYVCEIEKSIYKYGGSYGKQNLCYTTIRKICKQRNEPIMVK